MNVFAITLLFSFLLWLQNKYLRTPLRNTAQTYHKKPTSRLGGVAIASALFIDAFFLSENLAENEIYRLIVICSMPTFIAGLLDDLFFNIKPWQRLILMLPSPILLFYFAGLRVTNLNLGFLDDFLNYEIFALIFMIFALVGMSNAFNIIDGFNGLLLGYIITLALSIFFYGSFNDQFFISKFIYALFYSCLAVLIVNSPWGKIFLGDAGAYMLGILVPTALIFYYKINSLSPWFVMAMLIYPATEVFVSAIRKIIYRNMSAMEPDGLHLHMLIYKRVSKKFGFRKIRLRHFVVAMFIFSLNFPFMFFANVFSTNTKILFAICVWYVLVYLLIYFILLPKYIFKRK